MSALQQIEWDPPLVEPRRDRELEREVRKRLGVVPSSIRFFAPCPWIVRVSALANVRNGQLVHLELELADLIFLAVSQDNSCRYCYASQRTLLRVLGFDESRIRQLEQASFTAESRDRERLALDFARRMSRSNPAPSSADRDALLAAGFSEGAVKEIAWVAAVHSPRQPQHHADRGAARRHRDVAAALAAAPGAAALWAPAAVARAARPARAAGLGAQDRPLQLPGARARRPAPRADAAHDLRLGLGVAHPERAREGPRVRRRGPRARQRAGRG